MIVKDKFIIKDRGGGISMYPSLDFDILRKYLTNYVYPLNFSVKDKLCR